ncbi:MAG: hypothetical protein ACK4Q5_03030 [Saprospiraceae bacterium]
MKTANFLLDLVCVLSLFMAVFSVIDLVEVINCPEKYPWGFEGRPEYESQQAYVRQSVFSIVYFGTVAGLRFAKSHWKWLSLVLVLVRLLFNLLT